MGRSMSSTATQVMWKLDDIVRNRQEMAEKEFARAERNQYQTNKIANRKIDSAEKIQEMMNSGALDIQELKNSGILSKTEMEQAGLTERAIIKDRGDSSRTQMKEGGMDYRQQAGFENDRTKPVWKQTSTETDDGKGGFTTQTGFVNVNTAENRNDGQDGGSLGANDDVKSMLQPSASNGNSSVELQSGGNRANYGDPRRSQQGTGYVEANGKRIDIVGNKEQPERSILPRGAPSQPAVASPLDAIIDAGLTVPNQRPQPVIGQATSNASQTPVPLASPVIAARPQGSMGSSVGGFNPEVSARGATATNASIPKFTNPLVENPIMRAYKNNQAGIARWKKKQTNVDYK